MSEREYFVLSIAHTQRRSSYITLWAPDDSGYRGRMATAGRYTESQIKACLGYYNDGENTIAVPCDVLESLSHPVTDGFFDVNGGRWLRNNRATWQAAIKHAIAPPKHRPHPEYRRAPRTREESNA